MKNIIFKSCLLWVTFCMAIPSYGQLGVRWQTPAGQSEPLDITMISSMVLHPVWLKASGSSNANPIIYDVLQAVTTEEQLDRGSRMAHNNSMGGSRGFGSGDGGSDIFPIAPAASISGSVAFRGLAYADCDEDMNTFQSSASFLDFGNEQECTIVRKAFLYWTGAKGTNIQYRQYPDIPTMRSHIGGLTGTLDGTNNKTVMFRAPGDATYTNVTGDFIQGGNGSDTYTCVADVTHLVAGKGGGLYWVANVRSQTNTTSAATGWSLVVVFEPPNCPPRSIVLWDGIVNEGTTTPWLNLPAQVPANNVSYLGFGGLDTEDLFGFLYYENGSNVANTINAARNSNIQVNGTPIQPFTGTAANGWVPDQPGYTWYARNGAWITDDAQDGIISSQLTTYNRFTNINGNQLTRIPSVKYTAGYDAHHLRMPANALGAGATQVQLKLPDEQYGGSSMFMAYLAVETVQPQLMLRKWANEEEITLGGTITYNVTVRNRGSAIATAGVNNFVTDTLDLPLDFVPGSVRIYNQLGTDITGSTTHSITGQSTNNEWLKVMLPTINPANTAGVPQDSIKITFQANVRPWAGNEDIWRTGCRRTLQNKATAYFAISGGVVETESNAEFGCGGGDVFANVFVNDAALDAEVERTHNFIVNLGQMVVNPGNEEIIPWMHNTMVSETAGFAPNNLTLAEAQQYTVTDMDNNPIAPGMRFDPSMVEQTFLATKDVSTDNYECIETFNILFRVVKIPTMAISKVDPLCPSSMTGKITATLTDGGSGFVVRIVEETEPDKILFTSRTRVGQPNDVYNAAYFNPGTYKVMLEVQGELFDTQTVVLNNPGDASTLVSAGAGVTSIDANIGEVCPNTTFTLTQAKSGDAASYTTYIWKKSTDGGTSWTNVTGGTSQNLTVTGGISANTLFRAYACNSQCQIADDYQINLSTVPQIANKTAVIYSSETFIVDPATLAEVGDVVPLGTVYSWTVVDNPNVTGESNQSNQSVISQTLINNSDPSTDQTVIYTVTPKVGDCTGPSFTVTVTVRAIPTFAQSCSGEVEVDGEMGASEPWQNTVWTEVTFASNGSYQSTTLGDARGNSAGRWKATYDNEFVYLFIEVYDDQQPYNSFYNDPWLDYENPSRGWRGDGVELYLDAGPDECNGYPLQLGLTYPPSGTTPGMYGNQECENMTFTGTEAVINRWTTGAGYWSMEVKFPAAANGVDLTEAFMRLEVGITQSNQTSGESQRAAILHSFSAGDKYNNINALHTIEATPRTWAVASPAIVCSGAPVTLTPNVATYTWQRKYDTDISWNTIPSNIDRPTNATLLARDVAYRFMAIGGEYSCPAYVSIQPATPSPAVSPVSYCAGETASALTATGSNLKWYNDNNPATTALGGAPTPLTNAATDSRSYWVSQTLNDCESPRAEVVVTIIARPTAVLSGATSICNTGSTNLTVTFTGTPNFTFEYAIDGVTQSPIQVSGMTYSIPVSPTSTTTYSLVSLFDTNCTAVASDLSGTPAVTVNDKPTVADLQTPQPICAGNNLTATVNVTNDNGSTVTGIVWKLAGTQIGTGTSLSYQVNYADNGKTLTVEVTNACGTTTKSAGNITVNDKPTVAINLTSSSTLCAGNNLTASPNVTEKGSPVTAYSWKLDGTEISTNENLVYAVLYADNGKGLTLTVTTDCGNVTSTPAIIITVNGEPTVGNISAPAAVCSGGNLTLTLPTVTANGSTIISQYWEIESTGGTFSTFSAPFTVTHADNGKLIRYSVTGSCGNTVYSNEVAITVNDKPTVADLQTPQPICAGGNLTATINVTNDNGSTVTGIVWKLAGTQIGTDTSLSYQVNYADNGKTLTVEVTNACGTTIKSAGNITVIDKPTAAINLTSSSTLCAGNNLTASPNVTEKGSPVTAYSWKLDGTEISTNENLVYAVLYADNGKGLTLTVTTDCGTVTSTPAITITVNDKPTVAALQTPAPLCAGANLTVTANVTSTNGSAVTTYIWKLDGTQIGTGINLSYQVTTANNGQELTLEVTNGCGTTTVSAGNITVNTIPTVSFTVNGNPATTQTICSGNDTDEIVLVSTPAGASFVWTVQATGVVGASDGNGTSIPETTLALMGGHTTQGNVIYSVTPTLNSCQGSAANFTVYVNPIPAAPSSLGYSSCPTGTSEMATWASLVNNYTGTLKWYEADGTTPMASAPANFDKNVETTITHYVSQIINNCESATVAVTVNIENTPFTLNVDNLEECAVLSGTTLWSDLVDTQIGDNLYWYSADSDAAILPGEPTAIDLSNPMAATPYWVVVERNGGCKSHRTEVSATILARPTAVISGTTSICANGQATLSVNFTGRAPFEFEYSNGSSVEVTSDNPFTFNVSPTSTTTYTLLSLSDLFCSAVSGDLSGSATVTVNNAPIVNNITSPTAACAGNNLALTAPTVTPNGSTISNSYWEIENAVGSGNFIAFSNPVIISDNGKQIRYTVESNCGNVSSNAMPITVNATPSVTGIVWPQPVCEGENLIGTIATIDDNGSAVTGIVWKLAGTQIGTSASLSYLANYADNGKDITVEITNGCGTLVNPPTASPGRAIAVIYQRPAIGNKSETISNNTAFTVTPQNGVNSDIVPAGTTYTWVVSSPNANITGAYNQTTPQTVISQTLTNSAVTAQSVTYTVTPSANGCDGTPFTVTVTVTSTPNISNVTRTIDSGNAFSVTPGVDTAPTDVVPSGTTYTWVISQNNSTITGQSAQTAAVNAPISQTLTNLTDQPQTVVYTVTPTANGNTGNTFTITVIVNPRPKIANVAVTINSTETFNVSPVTNGGISGNDIVPSNTLYTWTIAPNANVTGQSANATPSAAPIGQQLTNLTDQPQTVVYTVTPKAGTAEGASFTITVTVNPQPRIANVSVEICTGYAFSVTPVTNGGVSSNDIVPSNTVYTWTVAPNTNISGQSANATPQSAPISQTLTNTSGANETVIYTVTPTAGTSIGSTFTITVTVKSTPAPTANNYIATCLRAGTETWISRVTATGTLKWYKNATDITETAAPTTFDKNVEQDVSYWVSQTIDGCESERTKVTVNISNVPNPAVVNNYEACATIGTPISWEGRVQTLGSQQWFSEDIDGAEISEPAAFDPNVPQQLNYWVAVTDAAGCIGKRTEVSATVNALPASTVQLINNVTCPNGNDGAVSLVSVNDGQSPFTYSWKNAGGTQVSTSAQVNNLVAGVYTLTVTDTNSCSANSEPVTVIDMPDTAAPIISGTITSQDASHMNDCIFRVPDVRNLVRAISNDNCTPQHLLDITQVPALNTIITENTVVTVTVIDASGNTTTTTVDVILPTMPTLTFQPIDPLCENAAPIALNASNSDGVQGTFSGTGVTGTTFNPSIAGAGTHTITYTVRRYGCVMMETQDVTVYPIPVITVGAPNICPNDKLTFQASPLGYSSYEWTIDNVRDTEQTGSTYIYNEEKVSGQQIQISVVAVSEIGCRSNPAVAIATVKTVPTIELVKQPIFCVAEYGTRIHWRDLVTASENRVQWFETEDGQTPIVPNNIDQSVSGSYTLYAAAIGNNGCLSAPIKVAVTVNESPVLDNIDTSDLSNIRVTVSGGLRPYIYHIEGVSGNTDGLINLGFLSIGRHQLLVVDRNGCLLDTFVPVLKLKLIPDEYFSPNGDGLNELWNIKNLEYYLDDNITIHIFDRTGKELVRYDAREFKNLGGWDGRFNGKLLPSTDYWYLITIGTLGERMTGHFTLKR